MAAALPTKPIFEVFSRKCGVSETMEAGIAMHSFFFFNVDFRLVICYYYCVCCLKAKKLEEEI
jgi:hypothetical protein